MVESNIRVLIVASSWDRTKLENMLHDIGIFTIVGKFSDFAMGISLLDGREPCFVFTELEMPQNDGIGFLEILKSMENVKVSVVSRLLRYSSSVLFEELKKFKPMVMSPMPFTYREVKKFSEFIIDKLVYSMNEAAPPIKSYTLNVERYSKVKGSVTVIGGSTGALTSLYKVLDMFKPDDESLIVVALHTIKSRNVIEKISCKYGSHVVKVGDSEKVELGKVYLLRSGRNYRLVFKNGNLYFKPFKTHLALGYRPSINLIMENFSALFRERCTGVILSGYGNDGVLGGRLIVMRGGMIIVQDPITAKASSMPQLTIRMMEELGKQYEILKI